MKKVDFSKINLNDKKLFQMINEGNTTGLFQVNTAFMTRICKEINIQRFEDLCAAIALGRPGPYDSGMYEIYVRRKKAGRWKKRHKVWENITKETYGVIVYQEQVMQALVELAGMTYSDADKIRKIISKKRDPSELGVYKKNFIGGCAKKKIITKQEASNFWEGLLKHARYSFNKSHSVEYAMLAMWTAHCKYYHPREFIAATLSYMPDNRPEVKTALLEEAVRMGLKPVLPKWGVSDGFRWVVRKNKLYVPFIEVKGLGEKTVNKFTASQGKKKQKGFFPMEGEDRPKEGSKVDKIMKAIGAYNKKREEPGGAQDYFDFQLVGDFSRMYPKLYALYEEDLTSVDFKDAEQAKIYREGIINDRKNFRSKAVLKCRRCKLRKECRKPVPNSRGKYNIAIQLEAPGFYEDKEGRPAIAKAGNLLWKELKKYRLTRSMFHVTNTNKCYPGKKLKTPTTEQIIACSKWLNREYEAIDCKLVLACGGNSKFFFTGDKAGIRKLSGEVMWDEVRGLWVVFCVHPSSVLRNSKQNKEAFERGVAAFVTIIKRFI